MTAFQYNEMLLICPSQGIRGEAEVKESGDCVKNPSGGAAGKEQTEAPGPAA